MKPKKTAAGSAQGQLPEAPQLPEVPQVGELAQLPELPCLCAMFRRTARVMTQLYDDAVRPVGIRGTQFTILQALTLTGEISQGGLGEILGLDSTTLTRTLAVMRRRGWVSRREGRDGRQRLFLLAKAGRKQFERALPHWQGVQERLREQTGAELWRTLFAQNQRMTSVAQASLSHAAEEKGAKS